MSSPSKKKPENEANVLMESSANEALDNELSEKELKAVQGGALTAEQVAEVNRLANQSADHHGVKVIPTIAAYTLGTFTDFAANAAGEAVGKKTNKKKN